MEIKTKYFIVYVYPVDAYGNQSFYYQLVRTCDSAILYSNENLDCIKVECWNRDISKSNVTIL